MRQPRITTEDDFGLDFLRINRSSDMRVLHEALLHGPSSEHPGVRQLSEVMFTDGTLSGDTYTEEIIFPATDAHLVICALNKYAENMSGRVLITHRSRSLARAVTDTVWRQLATSFADKVR